MGYNPVSRLSYYIDCDQDHRIRGAIICNLTMHASSAPLYAGQDELRAA